jgi:biopolymer transport protein ExbD
MSIRFLCSKCSSKLVVHDRFAERNIRCPRCDFELSVPKPSAQPEPEQERFPSTQNLSEQFDSEDDPAIPNSVGESDSGNGHDENLVQQAPKSRYRSLRSGHDDKEEVDLEWDITPMVDVAFLLLIFFMLTASFSIQRAISTVTSPESDKPSRQVQSRTDPELSVIVQVDEFNGYMVITSDGESHDASSKQELIVILQDLRSEIGAQSKIIVQAHMDSIHGAVVACLDAAREAEFTKFQVKAVEEF